MPVTLAFIISYCFFKFLLNKRIDLKLVAEPNSNTVTHLYPTPLIGGLGIFIGVIFPLLVFLNTDFPLMTYVCGLLPLIVLGLYKDRFQAALSPIVQLLFQIATSLVLYFHWNEVNQLSITWLNSIYFVIICCIIINAYNFIDVMDGLAGSYILSVLVVLGISLAIDGHVQYLPFVFSFVGAILAFLKFNWTPAKLFMGDLGSFGLIYTVLFVFISVRPTESNSVVIGYIFILFLIMFEFTFTVTKRIFSKKFPWIGDGVHISTILLKKGVKSQTIVIYAIMITVLTNLIGLYFFKFIQ